MLKNVSGGSDLRIDNGLIVSLNHKREVMESGSVVIQGSKILDVGKTKEIASKYPAEKTIDATDKIILPGFINTHAHVTAEFATRGFLPDDLRIFEWAGWMLPLYESMTAEEEYLASKLAFVESIKSGTTCFLGSGTEKHIGSVIKAMGEIGIKGVLSESITDVPGSKIFYK